MARGHLLHQFLGRLRRRSAEARQQVSGKSDGQTANVERWNNTLRQRLGQFVRRTLSFSKSDRLHDARLQLFMRRYNQELPVTSA